MKSFLLALALLFSFVAHATETDGYVKNIVPDDEGIKIVLSKISPESEAFETKHTEVKTIYLSNTQPDFEQTKQLLLDSKISKTRLLISKDQLKKLTVKQLGQ